MSEPRRPGARSHLFAWMTVVAEALLWILSGVAFCALLRGGLRGLIGGVAISLVVVAIWALCLAPSAPLRPGPVVRAAGAMLLCLLAAVALILAGLPIGGVALSVCAIILGVSQLAPRSP